MNKIKTLLIDLDCTLVNMLPPWLEKYSQITGENVSLEDVTEYNVTSVCKNEKVLLDLLVQPGFFYDMEPFPNGVEVVQRLIDEGFDVLFVTQPPRKAELAVRDKRRWVKKYFPDFDLKNMIFCHRKELVRGDLLFDDNPEHIKSWRAVNVGKPTASIKYAPNAVDIPECSWLFEDPNKAWTSFREKIKAWNSFLS